MSEMTTPTEFDQGVPDQPDGIQAENTDDNRIPAPDAAAARVVEFVKWFGDGSLTLPPNYPDEAGPALYMRDLCALACAVQHGYRAEAPSRCLHQPLAARPAPVVSGEDLVDMVAQALADDWNPGRDPILTAMFRDYARTALDALGITVADTPAADDEGGRE